MTMREELNGDHRPMPAGATLEDVWHVAEAGRIIASKCYTKLQEFDVDFGKIMNELGKLAAQRISQRPPPRQELPSIMDPVEFARKVKDAALTGLRTEGTTPEEQVNRQIQRYNDAQELARLRKEKEDRGKTVAKWILMIFSVVIAALLGKYIR